MIHPRSVRTYDKFIIQSKLALEENIIDVHHCTNYDFNHVWFKISAPK